MRWTHLPGEKPKRKTAIPKPLSKGNEALALHLQLAKIKFEREYRFVPDRKFRADFYLPDYKILVEVEGGVWTQGRHTRPKGYIRDMEKYRLAGTLGFTVLRFPTDDAIKGKAIREIADIIMKRQHGY